MMAMMQDRTTPRARRAALLIAALRHMMRAPLMRAAMAGLIASLLVLAAPAPLRASEAAGPSGGLELVMVEEHGCIWCETWNAQIGPIYPKTEEGRRAPLRRVELHSPELAQLKLERPVSFTPTFLLVRNGRELDRIEGYPGDDFFWALLGMLLDKHLGDPSEAGPAALGL
jgi:hypothetical protein